MITTCQNCNAEFEAQRATAKFCSDKCRVQSNRKRNETDIYFNARVAISRIAKDMKKQDAINALKNLAGVIDDTLRNLES